MTSGRDTRGHGPWTVTSNAEPRTPLHHYLLSSVPPPLHVCSCARVYMCVSCVCVCVCVYTSSVRSSVTLSTTIRVTVCAKCDPRRGAESHGPRTVTPTAGPRTTLQHCLLSSCPPPPHFLFMSLHVTYTSPPTCICPVSSPPAPFSFCPPHFAA